MCQKELNVTRNGLTMCEKNLQETQNEPYDVENKLTKRGYDCILPSAEPFIVPSDFSYGTVHHHKLYLLSKITQQNFTYFQERCRQLNGKLAEYKNWDELMHINAFFQLLGRGLNKPWVALGLTDEGHEGNFTYMSSDEPVPDDLLTWGHQFSETKRPNGGTSVNCVVQYTSNWDMYDWPCDKGGSSGFILQKYCGTPGFELEFLCGNPEFPMKFLCEVYL